MPLNFLLRHLSHASMTTSPLSRKGRRRVRSQVRSLLSSAVIATHFLEICYVTFAPNLKNPPNGTVRQVSNVRIPLFCGRMLPAILTSSDLKIQKIQRISSSKFQTGFLL